LHVGIVAVLLVLAGFTPPHRRIPPIRISLVDVRPQPNELPPAPAATPQPTPQEAPQTAQPTPTPPPAKKEVVKPEPTPKPVVAKKEAPEKKVVVSKAKKVLDAEPTPKPRPTPKAAPTPAPTSAPTPRPRPTPPPSRSASKPTPPPAIDRSLLASKPAKSERVSIETTTGGDLSQTYYQIVLQILKRNFQPPFARAGLTCKIEFTILKDGTISNIQVRQSTGSSNLDRYAIQALRKTAKLPPLYDSFRENFLALQATFEYESTE
jgi:TonB family protein